MQDKTKRASVNIEMLTVWRQTADTEAEVTYGTANPIGKVLMTAADTPKAVTGQQEADGQIVEDYSAVLGGDLALGLTALSAADRTEFYGETDDNGTNVSNKNDSADYLCVAYRTKRADGKYNLKKYPKIRFSPQAETEEQQSSGGIKYSTISLKGNYINLINNGDARYVRYAVDPVADKDIIEKWFTDASYHKPAETFGTLTVESVAGTTTGKTAVTVTPTLTSGRTYVYKTATSITAPVLDDVLTTGWTSWNGTDEITAATSNKIQISEIDSNSKCKATGQVTVTVKA